MDPTYCAQMPNGTAAYSNELKELLTCMMQYDPTHRPTMTEIVAHPWL